MKRGCKINQQRTCITASAYMEASVAASRTLLARGANAAKNAALEIVRQKGVEKRIETAVDIGEAGERYLDQNQPGGRGR